MIATPNWCECLLKVYGSREELLTFINKAKGVDAEGESTLFSLNNFIHMPKELINTQSPSLKPNEKLIKKYGIDNWYDWRINNWGCYDNNTEVLTMDGWKFFKETTNNDKFITFNRKGRIEFQKRYRYVEKEYNNKMIHFKSSRIDLLVTPEHRMYIKTLKRKDYMFMEAKDIHYSKLKIKQNGNWVGKNTSNFLLPEVSYSNDLYTKILPAKNIKMSDWLEFFGYYISEGSLNKRPCKRGGFQYYIRIPQFNLEKRKKIKECLTRLPFKFYDTKRDLIINNYQLYSYLKQFGMSKEKYIPKDIKVLSKNLLLVLYNSLILGDGTSGRNNDVYYTISKKLIDDFQEICLKLGWIVNIYIDDRIGKITTSGNRYNNICYCGRVRKKWIDGTIICKDKIKKVEYKGRVYCVAVPNEILLVRRNGKVAWCGNTKWDINPDSIYSNIEGLFHVSVKEEIIKTKNVRRVYYAFDTPWSPPEAAIKVIGRMFPKLKFVLKYWEGGACFQGKLVIKNGRIIEDKCGPYSGKRGG